MSSHSENRPRPDHSARGPSGFSLIELLIVLTVLAIVTGAIISNMQSSVNDQLDTAAQIVASDLYYVRNLAVSNNSRYQFTFSPATSAYHFEHSGSNPVLDVLPASPHGGTPESPTRQSTDIARFAMSAAAVEIATVQAAAEPPIDVTDLEFGPLGETTRGEATIIWLSAGRGEARRYVPLTVNPITGNTSIGQQTVALPGAAEDPLAIPDPEQDPYAPPDLPPDSPP